MSKKNKFITSFGATECDLKIFYNSAESSRNITFAKYIIQTLKLYFKNELKLLHFITKTILKIDKQDLIITHYTTKHCLEK